jgi:hypothetical protein
LRQLLEHAVRLISEYYSTWLPGACLLKIDRLLESQSMEISLGSAGALKRSTAMIVGLIRISIMATVLIGCNLMTVYWVATQVSVPIFPSAKIIGISISVLLLLGAFWMFIEFVVGMLKREVSKVRATPGALLVGPKQGRLAEIAKGIKLGSHGAYKGNARLYVADQVIVKSREVIDQFLKWEKENRKLLEVVPEVTPAADAIRKKMPELFDCVISKRERFKANSTVQNQMALDAALLLLRKESGCAKRLMDDYAFPYTLRDQVTPDPGKTGNEKLVASSLATNP